MKLNTRNFKAKVDFALTEHRRRFDLKQQKIETEYLNQLDFWHKIHHDQWVNAIENVRAKLHSAKPIYISDLPIIPKTYRGEETAFFDQIFPKAYNPKDVPQYVLDENLLKAQNIAEMAEGSEIETRDLGEGEWKKISSALATYGYKQGEQFIRDDE